MIAIIVLIFIVYAYTTSNSIKKLQEENKMLKKELQKMNSINKEEIKYNVENKIIQESNIKSEVQIKRTLTEEEKIQRKIKEEKIEREKKNTSILITGALLIVLAAIVFLMSTWNVIPSILKTLVMLFFIGVFLGASKIAKNRFKLEKTSLTFFYIAMAYIPICLISCSIFGLFGEFLSITGEGRYIYLTGALLITSLIYYYYYKINNSKILLLGTILSQIFAIILFTLIFEEKLILVEISLIIYNIILTIISNKNKEFELLSNIYINIPYLIGIISLWYVFNSNIYMLILLPLLAINFFILKPYHQVINSYCMNIAIYLFGFYITFILNMEIFSENISLIFNMAYLLAISSLNLLFVKDKNIAKSARVVSLINGVALLLNCYNYENIFIKPYVISTALLILILLYFMKTKDNEQKIYCFLAPIAFIITGVDILKNFDARYYCFIIFGILTFVLGELIRNKKLLILNNGFFIISHIFIFISYLTSLIYNPIEVFNNVIIYVLLEIVYVYSLIKNFNNRIFKYLIYIIFALLLNSIVQFLQIDIIEPLILPITAILILVIENKNNILIDYYSEAFNIILQIISYIALVEFNHESNSLLVFLYSAFLIFENIKNNKNQYLRCVPMIGALAILNSYNAVLSVEYNILLILLSTVALSLISISRGVLSVDTIFSGIYLINLLTYFDNEIIRNGFLTIWSLVNMYFMKTQKSTDFFKGISFISVFLLYYSLIESLGLNIYNAFLMMGITVLAIGLIKDIMKNYSDNTDIVEYVILLIIYLFSLVSYNNEKDGMIFGIFLVCLLIFSYIKKYGAVFLVTLGAIILNAILLTREFWLLIPWWIYLLIIGFILIAFAVKNESDENKFKAQDIIKNIKDKIEK